VGFNLFVLQSMTRRDIGYVSRVAFPFFLIMLFFVIVIYLFPDVVTWLPRQMGKG
jgi:TRAP-type C4-dicarboxylate transport system permease large subunit